MSTRLNPLELAWAAGFVDGEGSFIAPYQEIGGCHTCTPGLRISQLERPTLVRFREAVGVGKVYGPYAHGKNPIYQYQVAGFEKTQYVYAILFPYLSTPKREQGRFQLEKYHEHERNRR